MAVSDGVAALATRIATEFKSVRTALTGKASTTHAATHGSGGSDPVSPGAIGAATAGHSHPPSTPAAHASSHAPGASDPLPADQSANVASVRTLGTGAQQAAPGTAPAGAVAAHESIGDPHPQYLTQPEGDARYSALGSGAQNVNYYQPLAVESFTPPAGASYTATLSSGSSMITLVFLNGQALTATEWSTSSSTQVTVTPVEGPLVATDRITIVYARANVFGGSFTEDIEITAPTRGVIMKDRVNGNRYRLYFSNGVLASELVT